MASTTPMRRLICCVDGTYCTPEGRHKRRDGNISNTYRVCASIKHGVCQDSVTNKDVKDPRMTSTCMRRPKLEYQARTTNIWSAKFTSDAVCWTRTWVWFYGFSRGAYIVRAVAGLLHWLNALPSAGTQEFSAEYSKALKKYCNPDQRANCGPGQIGKSPPSPDLRWSAAPGRWLTIVKFHHFYSLKTKPAPQIQFIGVFDTVKALDDKESHDISFNDFIQHFRHALALDEDRKAMTPEYVFPSYDGGNAKLSRRSIIQA